MDIPFVPSLQDQGNGPVPLQDGQELGQEPNVRMTGVDQALTLSPIRKDPSEGNYFAINTPNLDLAIEDDETLELNMQLGEVQERNLKRKIEHRKRHSMNSSSGGGVFNLSRELSLQIDLDRAALQNDLILKNEALAHELATVKANASQNHADAMHALKLEMQQ